MNSLLWSGSKCDWHLSSARIALRSAELFGARVFIAVSLKNREFSNRWLRGVLLDIQLWKGEATITLVDSPYFTNIELVANTPQQRRGEVEKLKKIRSEQEGRIKRQCAAFRSGVYYLDWQYFQTGMSNSHNWISDELTYAFGRKERVHTLITQHVSNTFGGNLEHKQIERLSGFLLEEIPVLLYVYYIARPQWIDVYPGPQAEIIWAIDEGALDKELPRITDLATRSAPLRYAEVFLKKIA